ncbi:MULTISPECIES: DUF7344 domain-containing protein [Halorussus]|uniref:DUF7344 domain-containing protein n=1 Tax=Halorussus TaxID=1070314 RepID=UPI00209D7B52|nr:hypothetical protein [Halorussus vallis]USZ77026.1 hypothetical protein NGM07_06775 [Halorussus vallis]
MSVETQSPSDEPATSSKSETTEELSVDQVFHLLQTERRRNALKYLARHDGPVEMRDMAEQVAAWEYDTTVEGLTSDQRQRVYIGLYQTHLPKLDEAGVVEYNQSRGIVERTPAASQFDRYLDDAPGGADEESDDSDGRGFAARVGDRWQAWRRRTTLFGAGALTTLWFNLAQFASYSNRVLSVTMGALLVAFAGFQYGANR